MKPDPLLVKCEELLVTLNASPDSAKLRAIIGDIEAMRDRLVSDTNPGTTAAARLRRPVDA